MSEQKEEGGWLHNGLVKVFGRSYRTTISGVLASVCGAIVVLDQVIPDPRLHIAAQVCAGLGLCGVGAVGYFAKDKKTTGAQ